MPCSGSANFTLSNGIITILFGNYYFFAHKQQQKALQRVQKQLEKSLLSITTYEMFFFKKNAYFLYFLSLSHKI